MRHNDFAAALFRLMNQQNATLPSAPNPKASSYTTPSRGRGRGRRLRRIDWVRGEIPAWQSRLLSAATGDDPMSAGQSGCRAWKRRVCNGPTTPGSRMAHARRRPWTRGHGDQLVQESLSLISLPKCRGDGTASRVRPLRKSRSSLLLPHAAASCVTNMISSPHQEGWTGGDMKRQGS